MRRDATIMLLVLAAVSGFTFGAAHIDIENATFSMSSGPGVFIVAALLSAAFFLVLSRPVRQTSKMPPTRLKAVIAAAGDLLFAGYFSFTFWVLALIGIESVRAGRLAWVVQREVIWSDYILLLLWPVIAFVFIVLPLANGRCTVGHYLARVAMIPKSYQPSYVELALLSMPAFVSLIASCQYIFFTRRWNERVSDLGGASMLGFDVYEDAE